MSGFKKIQCELQKKPWNDYSSDEIRRYCFTNLKCTDCSFVDSKTGKVYKSFKWILCEISPVLTKILNDEKNEAKDCKEIVVSNPSLIKAILFYAHMKVVHTEIVNLVDFYAASKEYEVKVLEDEVIKMFESEENQEKANWVKLFWLSYVKYPEDQQMRAIFEKIRLNDTFVETNTNGILKFTENVFDILFDIIVKRGVDRLKCFKITEAYLIKHLFDGDKEKPIEDLGEMEKDLVHFYFDKLGLSWKLSYNSNDLQPLSSKLLSKSNKIKILNEMRKMYKSYGFLGTPEIDEYLRKLQSE